jgi:hypothetical protein
MVFFMVSRAEAVLPTELQYGSLRVQAYQTVEAEQAQLHALDLLKESRDIAITKSVRYQQMLRRCHA